MSILRRTAKRILRSGPLNDLRFSVDRRCGRLRGSSGAVQVYGISVISDFDPMHLKVEPREMKPVITAGMITDMDARFVADPFLLKRDEQWWMFFEVWNNHAKRGEIACARSDDFDNWTYRGRVLREHFHLSYPHVFEEDGEVYMVPETWLCGSGAVRLYKAVEFPHRWVFVATLLDGPFVDSSIFRTNDVWWMMTTPNVGFREDELHLYWAKNLRGPWHVHSCSPIVSHNRRAARPAGRVFVQGELLIRFAQVCEPYYGTAVRSFRITELSPSTYREEPLLPDPVLYGSGGGWNADGMHHIDVHMDAAGRWLACVDGWMKGPAWPAAGAAGNSQSPSFGLRTVAISENHKH